MRRLPLLALGCAVAGLALLAYAAATNQGQVHLVVIFPVFTGTGLASLAGMLLIMAAMLLGFLSLAGQPAGIAPSPPPADAPPALATTAPAKRFGGVVFLGPFPLVFGSDATVSKWMLVLGVAMTVLLLAFFFLVLSRP